MPTANTAAPMTTRAGRLVMVRFVLGTTPSGIAIYADPGVDSRH
jgi:hypothetical protein